MPASTNIAEGSILDNRFVLTEKLAEGGMSVVYRARDLNNGEDPVAVKVPKALYASGTGSWSMSQQEEAIGTRLDHPYVLKFLPAAEAKRRAYIVTEYVPGPTLQQRLASERVIAEAEATLIAIRLCEALEHIHERGYVHYDLKPANVILCPNGSIRLIDFGLAHAAVRGRFSLTGAPPMLGTPEYVAPEQIRRKRGRRSADVYGVGAMLYEMVTGQLPFPDDDPFQVVSARLIGDPVAPSQVNQNVSPAVEEIILRAMRRNPKERYQDMASLRAALANPKALVIANLRDRLQPVTRWRKSLRLVRYVAIVVLLPILSQVILFLCLWHHLAKTR